MFLLCFCWYCGLEVYSAVSDSAVGLMAARYLEGTMTHSCRVPAAE